MARFIFALMVFAMTMAVLKMVLIAIVLAGLIFRPKETIGLILFFVITSLIAAYPAPTLVVFGTAAAIALYRWAKRQPSGEPPVIHGDFQSPALPAPDPPPT